MEHLEIERKYLIKMPDKSRLSAVPGVSSADITQTYLTGGVRLRKWEENGKITYIKTQKRKISELTRVENEEEITAGEYTGLLSLADPERLALQKTRYRLPWKGKTVEIDIFPFWKNQAYLEIELEREDEAFSLPGFIEIIREVTFDKAYRNYSLSKNIPKEEIF